MLNKFLYQKSVYFFLGFTLLALIAFWPNYYSNPARESRWYIHFHGIMMGIWCIMLIAQSLLIRLKQFKLHAIIGGMSYLIAPLLIVSGITSLAVIIFWYMTWTSCEPS